MKTIFRYACLGLLTATIFGLSSIATFAQDPCADTDGQGALDAKFRELYSKKGLDDRKAGIETGKQFLEKYGTCEGVREFAEYLKGAIPKLEDSYKKAVEADAKAKLIVRFNAGLASKGWDEVYASGKELLTKYPDEFRDVELVLGTIGYDESYKNNFKYNDDTLRYARISISDLESGKTFSASFGVPKDFVYRSKDNALGWMNYTIGYITQVAQKNKKDALPFLYKATQINSETNKNPIPYELIGYYYFDELDKLTTEIKAAAADQKDTDTPEVAKQKVDAIKAKVALSNGTAERAMDAFSRAYTLATPAAKDYKAKMKTNVENAYNLRFAKKEGVDAWITTAVSKPFVSPMTPITPISDPEPVAPVTTTTTSTTPPATTKPAAPIKPAAVPVVKPATPPGKSGAKPQAVVKKVTVKKKAA